MVIFVKTIRLQFIGLIDTYSQPYIRLLKGLIHHHSLPYSVSIHAWKKKITLCLHFQLVENKVDIAKIKRYLAKF